MDKRPFCLLRQGFLGWQKPVDTPETAWSGFGDKPSPSPLPVNKSDLVPEFPTALFQADSLAAHQLVRSAQVRFFRAQRACAFFS